jgi:hypothetical protein
MPSSLICSSRLRTISGAVSARSHDNVGLMLVDFGLGGRKSGGESEDE